MATRSKTNEGGGDFLQVMMGLSAEEAVPSGLAGRWWVAHTKPRTEKVLAKDLHGMGLTFYLPLRKKQTRSRATRRISRSIVPVFSGYVFFNVTQEQRFRALATNRIAHLLEPPDQEQLVNELRQIHRVLAANVEYKLHSEIKVGERARVTQGPLVGAEGVVIDRLSGARLVLNVGMLGQSISVNVDREVLERM